VPNRILREGILTSPRMIKLNWAEEVFYRRLISIVDDFGRYHADPMLLRAACYPRQLDKVSDSDVGKWTRATAEAGLVRVYEVAGQPYLELLDFRQQKRAQKSKFPAHDEQMPSERLAPAVHPPSNAHLGGGVFEGEGGVEKRASRGSRLLLKAIPEDWKTFCQRERADLDPEGAFERFRDYWIAKPGKDGVKVDWLATWRNWVRNERAVGKNGSSVSWWASEATIIAKGKELGLEPRPGESTQEFKGRVAARIGT